MNAAAATNASVHKPAKLKNVEDIYPMSPMQQGILFHSLYETGSGLYFLGMGCRIEGALDVQAFRRAWEEVIRRHATLRSSLLWEGLNQPRQVVRKHVDLPWLEEDWRGRSAAEQRTKWNDFLADDRARGFDFKRAPLLRLALMRTGENSYYFSWAGHHVMLDGWARQIVMGEAFTLYEAYRQNRRPEVKPPRLYRDYISWLQKQDEKKAETFWREELKGFSKPTKLGIELEPKALGNGENQHGFAEARLSREQTARLEEISRNEMVTLSTILRAAWALVLGRYAGEEDVLFGATVSGRSGGDSGFEETVGLFINTLPVRVKLNSGESVRDYLQRMHQQHARTLDYEYSRLPKVQDWSDVPRGIALFDTIVVFENYPLDAAIQKTAGSTLKFSEIGTVESTSYPLGVVIRPGKELSFLCLHNRQWFDGESIERLLGRLLVALENISRKIDGCIGDISLLTETEREELETGWCGAAVVYQQNQSIGALVACHAERRPQAMALVSEEQTLTYRELNRKANQWANYLRMRGIQPGTRVAVCLEQNADRLVISLGVLKSGAVLAGLEAEEPFLRLARMLKSSHAAAVITVKSMAEELAAAGAQVLQVEELQGEVMEQSEREPEVKLDSGGPACVLYRSSAAGRPVGVVLPQRALCGPELTEEAEMAKREPERVAQRLSFAQEAESLEWWRTLASGDCLVSVNDGLAPRRLANLLREQRVTVLWASATIMERLAREFPWALKNVREIICEEQISVLFQLRETLPAELLARVHGASGYSEAGGCWMKYPLAAASKSGTVRLDHLQPGIRLHLLNKKREPVGEGMMGEIYLSGECAALNYEHDESHTGESLLPDACSHQPEARMYRTGTRARWRANGVLECEEHKSDQAVISGIRVCVQEIDAALLEHPQIREAATVRSGNDKFVAFVAPLTELLDPASLMNFVKERLPAVMVPQEFRLVEAIPRMEQGQVDQQGLLQLASPGSDAVAYAEPRNEIEHTMARVWAETLAVERVGIHDNFFRLGGDSLLIMQMVWKIRDLLGVEIPINKFFETPTIAQLSQAVEEMMGIDPNWQFAEMLPSDAGAVNK
jgi:non-ribosomal peptide synthetase component F/acyl carrier protein